MIYALRFVVMWFVSLWVPRMFVCETIFKVFLQFTKHPDVLVVNAQRIRIQRSKIHIVGDMSLVYIFFNLCLNEKF